MTILDEILIASKEVDEKFLSFSLDALKDYESIISVPIKHPRAQFVKTYVYKTGTTSNFIESGDLILIDKNISLNPTKDNQIICLEAIENNLKEISHLNSIIKALPACERIVGIGGGLVLNSVGYIAESLQKDLVYFPTSITAAADSVVGGKVRVNKIEDGKFYKHFHKTFYEPNVVCLDWSYFETLDDIQLTVGLAEIIKHGLYQSEGLTHYLLSEEFNPIKNKPSLLKAILWTVELKKKALDIDPEESADGSYFILRAGHDISDKIEEESGLTIPHTEAVLTGMYRDLKESDKFQILNKLYSKFGLNGFMY